VPGFSVEIFPGILFLSYTIKGSDIQRYPARLALHFFEDMDDFTSGVPGDMKPVFFNRFRRGKTTKSGKGPGLFIIRSP